MKNHKLNVNYDKKRNVMYVLSGRRNTINLPWSEEEEICFDPQKLEVAGYIITNFSHQYPKLAAHTSSKEKWFISDFFAQRFKGLGDPPVSAEVKKSAPRFFDPRASQIRPTFSSFIVKN